ncbi:MAG: cyclic pyranopterin monophosphate synthase MoaC [Lachnospiraceae bacterium]|nr:cyclic pyranopterin monophosphate synthase MoaC [Lachnospiraceae bacterium]
MRKNAVLCFAGVSGSGKTTLIEKIIKQLIRDGYRPAVIKHTSHDHELDSKGKDTYRFAKAGADPVMISANSGSARFDNRERTADEMIADLAYADIVLIEGYKQGPFDMIGLARIKADAALPGDIGKYRALAVDDPTCFGPQTDIPVFDINDAYTITKWIESDIMCKEKELTHFDDEGNARMVNVSGKDITMREASAAARVIVNKDTFELIKRGNIKKGDVLTVAQIAGIMGAKRTYDLIPMCHPLILDGVDLKLKLDEKESAIDIEATVKCTGRTGVEMEAICACSVAAMTVYDMCKSVQRDILITDIRLLAKSGGVHGDYIRQDGER